MFEITELNSNVIFELGMSIGLNRASFLFVHKDKIPTNYKSGDYPPKPLSGIDYIPYELGQTSISSKIKDNVMPIINALVKSKDINCKIISSICPYQKTISNKREIFVALPKTNKEFFDEVYEVIKRNVKPLGYSLKRHSPATSLHELCQICNNVRNSFICIIDTTYDDLSMLFALGVAFGKDKKFIQLHDVDLSTNRSISDLRPWSIEYRNIKELEERLKDEIDKRFKAI